MKEPIVFRRGSRITLRSVEEKDLDAITVGINEPEVTQFISVRYPITRGEETKWLESLSAKKSTDMVVAIALKETDEIIGTMGLHKIDHVNGTATTGSLIYKSEYHSKGYGTEAKMLLLEYAFNVLNLRKICSSVFDFNGRSKRCLEKCGYHQEGVKKLQIYRNGKYNDEILMAVFRKEFLPLWKKFKKEKLS